MDSYISFPKLGINLNVESVAFSVGGKEVYWYGIIIALGLILAVIVCMQLAKKYGMKTDTIIDIVLFGVPASVVGARLYYVAFRWDYYSNHIEEIFKIWNGGIAIYGAVIAAVITAVIYCKIKRENFWLLADIGGVGLPIGQLIGRWGNFFNQEAFGVNTTLPWGMTGDKIQSQLYSLWVQGEAVNPDLPVHPTFLYESLWNFVFVALALLLFKKRKFDGQIFIGYIIFYGIGRFFIEGLRTDSLYIGQFRISQIVALVCVAAGLWFMIYKLRQKDKTLTLDVI